ncbi:MAG: hypothetical protein RLY97_1243 [Pseudomonadota bacterium]|jgi:hypothetical protein
MEDCRPAPVALSRGYACGLSMMKFKKNLKKNFVIPAKAGIHLQLAELRRILHF